MTNSQLKVIGNDAFRQENNHSQVTEIILPPAVTYIGMSSFQNQFRVTSYTFPEGLKRIDHSAFASNNALVYIAIPSTVTYVHSRGFNGSQKLRTVAIQDGQLGYSSPASNVSFGGRTVNTVLPNTVTYHTNNGITRFNPNLYKNGKVCISILNTWKGEQWTSCQNIRSVLLTLVTLLNENPLTNEPGYAPAHRWCLPYKRIITYMNFKTSILDMVTKEALPEMFLAYYSVIKKHFLDNKENIIRKIEELERTQVNNAEDSIAVYKMHCKYDYTALKLKFLETL